MVAAANIECFLMKCFLMAKFNDSFTTVMQCRRSMYNIHVYLDTSTITITSGGSRYEFLVEDCDTSVIGLLEKFLLFLSK